MIKKYSKYSTNYKLIILIWKKKTTQWSHFSSKKNQTFTAQYNAQLLRFYKRATFVILNIVMRKGSFLLLLLTIYNDRLLRNYTESFIIFSSLNCSFKKNVNLIDVNKLPLLRSLSTVFNKKKFSSHMNKIGNNFCYIISEILLWC